MLLRRRFGKSEHRTPTATLHSLGASDHVPLTQSGSQDFPRRPSAGARPTRPLPLPPPLSRCCVTRWARVVAPQLQPSWPVACKRCVPRVPPDSLPPPPAPSYPAEGSQPLPGIQAPGCPLPLPLADHAARPAVRLRRAAAGHQVRGVSPRFCRRVLPGDGTVRCSAARASVAESLRCCSQHCLGPSPTQLSYAAVKSWSCITRSITRQAGGGEGGAGGGKGMPSAMTLSYALQRCH